MITLFFLLSLVLGSRAAIGNRTIDDSDGSQIMYQPLDQWTAGEKCTGCLVHADVTKAGQGTWHDTTFTPPTDSPRNLTATFNGTAVRVYCIIANSIPDTTTLTNLSFSIDGEVMGGYTHVPDGSQPTYMYDVNVYSNPSLPNGVHKLEMSATGGSASLVLFDYIEYTFDTDLVVGSSATPSSTSSAESSPTTATSDSVPNNSPTTSSKSNTGAIAGGVVGGMAVITLAFLYFFLRRRKRRAQKYGTDEKVRIDGGGEVKDDPFVMAERRPSPTIFSSNADYATSVNASSFALGSQYGYGQHGRGATDYSATELSHSDSTRIVPLRRPSSSAPPPPLPTSPLHQPSLPRATTSSPTGTTSSLISPVANSISAVQSKTAMRREEPSRLETQQQEVQTTSSVHSAAETSASNREHMLAIEALRREVETLRTRQQQLVSEMIDTTPPPAYDHDRRNQ